MSKNNQERIRMGLEPLPEGQGNEPAGNEGGTPAGGGAPAGDDGGDNGGQPGGGQAAPQNPTQTPAPAPQALSAEQLLEQIRKYNPNIKSLDDLKQPTTPADIEAKKKEKQNNMIAWALANKKIDADKINGYHVDHAKSDRDVVYEDFARRHEGKTPAQIDSLFEKRYMEDVDVDDPDTPEDEKELALELREELKDKARHIRKKRYPEMYRLESEYDAAVAQDEKDRTDMASFQQKETGYKSAVVAALGKHKVLTTEIGDEQNPEKFEFVVKPEIVQQVENEFLHNKTMVHYIATNASDEVMEEAIKLRLMQLTNDQRIAAVAKRYSAQQRANDKFGRNNLNPDDVHGSSAGGFERDEELWKRVGDYAPEPVQQQ